MAKSNTVNKGIDLGKFICALLVVSIHATLFIDFSEVVYEKYSFYISSIAVPFFFICNGYFLEQKISTAASRNEIRAIIGSTIKKLAPAYLFWGSIYFVCETIVSVFIDGKDFAEALIYQIHQLLVSTPGGGIMVLSNVVADAADTMAVL